MPLCPRLGWCTTHPQTHERNCNLYFEGSRCQHVDFTILRKLDWGDWLVFTTSPLLPFQEFVHTLIKSSCLFHKTRVTHLQIIELLIFKNKNDRYMCYLCIDTNHYHNAMMPHMYRTVPYHIVPCIQASIHPYSIQPSIHPYIHTYIHSTIS